MFETKCYRINRIRVYRHKVPTGYIVKHTMMAEEILRIASQMRTAFEVCDRAKMPPTFQDFPLGSCGDAALILGTHLKECGWGDFSMYSGCVVTNN